MSTAQSPILTAMIHHTAAADVVDVDHYRIHSGMAVETDYIIEVKSIAEKSVNNSSEEEGEFENFKVSKTYSAFRHLTSQLKKAADSATGTTSKHKKKGSWDSLPKSSKNVIKVSESVKHLIDSERTEYLGKVNYTYVKALAKQRRAVIDDALDVILTNFPKTDLDTGCVRTFMSAVETFFLTDHCVEEGGEHPPIERKRSFPSPKMGLRRKTSKSEGNGKGEGNSKKSLGSNDEPKGPAPRNVSFQEDTKPPPPPSENPRSITSPVVPLTMKSRRSLMIREMDEEQLSAAGAEATLLVDDRSASEVLRSKRSISQGGMDGVFDNPIFFSLFFVAGLSAVRAASFSTVTVDTDIAMLIAFACFCLGMHIPQSQVEEYHPPTAKAKAPPSVAPRSISLQEPAVGRRATLQRCASQLLRKSMVSIKQQLPDVDHEEPEEEEEAEPDLVDKPFDLGSPLPVFPEGAKLGSQFNCYSEPHCGDFKIRGPNYFKDKKKIPSGDFIFPTRGVDLFLTDLCPENVGSNSGIMGGRLRDVPTFIVNFRLPWGVLLMHHEIPQKFLPFLKKRYDPTFDSDLPSLENMSSGERAACRFLMGTDEHKNKTLKIVPVVVAGPWIVKSVAGGKPAIVGTKMPVTYIYQPANPAKKQAEYLEADLDIVSSKAARSILSVVRGYTSVVTIDLGFVVQGNETDELPEQMLIAARLHGIDPMHARPLPPMKHLFMELGNDSTDHSTDDSLEGTEH